MKEQVVIVVGAGPSGLAVGACLSRLSIPYVILEREDCAGSLWKNHAYDVVRLHLRKHLCELPHLPFPADYPPYVPRELLIRYLDDYASHFRISPAFGRTIVSAAYDAPSRSWDVRATLADGTEECYRGRFLVVATGESADPFIPEIEGLEGFPGRVMHSTGFKSGREFREKRVLVVGSGNSGMEIAFDLANHGAQTSIVVRSPLHVLSRWMVHFGVVLFSYMSFGMVDNLMVLLSKLIYGDLTKYGIARPKEGPFAMKAKYGKYPLIDVGTCHLIKSGHIQILPAEIEKINGSEILLKNGKSYQFDTIVFCTGFKRSTHLWLEGDDYMLNEDGVPKQSYPKQWRGMNGLYCVGLSGRGFYGAKLDAQNVADDIHSVLHNS